MLENPALGRYFPTFGFEQSGIWLSDMLGITLGKADAIAPRRRRMLPQPLANDLLRERIAHIGEQLDLH